MYLCILFKKKSKTTEIYNALLKYKLIRIPRVVKVTSICYRRIKHVSFVVVV